jgi:hypothetical protein
MRRWLVAAALLCTESALAVDYRKCIALDQAEAEAMASLSRDLNRLAASREAERELQKCGVKPSSMALLEGWYGCIYGTFPYASAAERQRYEGPIRSAHDRQIQSIFDQQLKLSCP